MDKIIEIQRKGGVARVKLLSGDTLKIPSPLFLERRLREGESLDPQAYRQFMLKRGYPHALEAAMKFLALRERSESEVRSRLKRSCYDDAVIAQVLSALTGHELVSDARFAAGWVHSRSKKYGRTRIAQELKFKGVSAEDAKNALDGLSEDDELKRAVEQAKKMSRRLQNDPEKILQALIRRGYHWRIAKQAIQHLGD